MGSSTGRVIPFILAGGFGTRLQESTHGVPKPLVAINGRPFITYLFDQLISSGFDNVIVCTGYRAEIFPRMLGSHYRNLDLHYSKETEPLGTGGAARLGASRIDAALILIMNGDSYCNMNLDGFISTVLSNNCNNGIVLTTTNDSSRYGSVIVNKHGMVTRFVEKDDCAGKGLINAGIYLFDNNEFKIFPENRKLSLEYDVIPKMTTGELYGYICDAPFIDIGTPESLNEARIFLRNIDSL